MSTRSSSSSFGSDEYPGMPDGSTLEPRNQILSPEDVACGALTRLFREDVEFPPNLIAPPEENRKRTLFNEDFDETAKRVYPRTPVARSPRIGRQPQSPSTSSSAQASPKSRHKSPMNRHHSPFSRDGILGWSSDVAVRKTRSTAFPSIINTPWPRSATASTPDLKVDDRRTPLEPLPLEIRREDGRRVYMVRTVCYYNFRLIYIILNCFVLVAGLVYLGSAVAVTVHGDTILVIVDQNIYVPCLISLYALAIVLLGLAFAGLCFVHGMPRRIATHAGCSLFMCAILIALAFLQSAAQYRVQIDAERRMLSTIQPEADASVRDTWDYFHEAFKCCGVRGYLDWCRRVNPDQRVNFTSAEDFLGSFTCKLPISCCEDNKIEDMIPKKLRHMPCVQSPTPWNTHRSGCVTPIRVEISYVGKMYRVMNFGTAVILLLTTAISMILFTYF